MLFSTQIDPKWANWYWLCHGYLRTDLTFCKLAFSVSHTHALPFKCWIPDQKVQPLMSRWKEKQLPNNMKFSPFSTDRDRLCSWLPASLTSFEGTIQSTFRVWFSHENLRGRSLAPLALPSPSFAASKRREGYLLSVNSSSKARIKCLINLSWVAVYQNIQNVAKYLKRRFSNMARSCGFL